MVYINRNIEESNDKVISFSKLNNFLDEFGQNEWVLSKITLSDDDKAAKESIETSAKLEPSPANDDVIGEDLKPEYYMIDGPTFYFTKVIETLFRGGKGRHTTEYMTVNLVVDTYTAAFSFYIVDRNGMSSDVKQYNILNELFEQVEVELEFFLNNEGYTYMKRGEVDKPKNGYNHSNNKHR